MTYFEYEKEILSLFNWKIIINCVFGHLLWKIQGVLSKISTLVEVDINFFLFLYLKVHLKENNPL